MIWDLLLKIFKKSDGVLARDQFLEKPQDDLTVPETPEIKGYENHEVVDRYTVSKPYAHVFILEDRDTRERLYYVYESPLNEYEVKVFEKLKRILEWELKPFDRSLATKSSLKMSELEAEKEYLLDQVRSLLKRYSIRLEAALRKRIDWNKIYYYLVRDSIGYGPLDVIMKDPYIEDVSCNGVGKPVYVWHQKYESMPTNIVFETEEELDSMVLKLVHKAGKHISSAFPIADAVLPEGHRLAATFRKEVSTRGSTFTIRKFKEKPLSVVDLVLGGTLDPMTAGYLWLAMEHKMPGVVIGVTGSGKTTMLNALATLFRPNIKVVTIEDTAELKLTLENWVQLVARPSYALGGSKVGEVTLYDLVKVSLRYRPDVIIVGEIRGEEAYVLFQAMATGHGGLTTAHAEHVRNLVRRLTSPPMNIPPSYIPLLKWCLLVRRVTLTTERGPVTTRRVFNVWEIKDYENYKATVAWDPAKDKFSLDLRESIIVREVSLYVGKTPEEIEEEVKRRATVIQWMALTGKRDYREVANVVYMYYRFPEEVYKRAKEEVTQHTKK
ncbi:MAG: type II/IV secretion system ATPase subunit [Acidilobaceae archaeon]